MHHQTAKAAYRILDRAADLVDERGFTKEPADNGKLTVVQAFDAATGGRSETAYLAALEAFEEVITEPVGTWQPRDKRQFISKLHAAAKQLAESTEINLEKV